jgi:signal transduction histidine kinase
MFAHLSTSRKIASYFAVYTLILVASFGIVINMLHFSKWWHDSNKLLDQFVYRISNAKVVSNQNPRIWWSNLWGQYINRRILKISANNRQKDFRRRLIRDSIQSVEINHEIQKTLDTGMGILPWVAQIDGSRILYRIYQGKLYYLEITAFINTQKDLLWITIVAIVGIAWLTYVISKQMVHKSLNHIHPLLAYVNNLSLHTVKDKVPLSGPKEDEIRQIAEALQSSLDTISRQSDTLRDFVAHASHELKTPLMSLTTSIDVFAKTHDPDCIQDAKEGIEQMKSLLDTLLLITRREYHQLTQQSVNLVEIIHHVIVQHRQLTKSHQVDIDLQAPESYYLSSHPDICHMIVNNLVNNAIKHSSPDSKVHIIVDQHTHQLSITNSGTTIDPVHQPYIYDRFYKIGSQSGSGLWLYLVKLLVDKQKRDISYSDHDGTNHFVINFH